MTDVRKGRRMLVLIALVFAAPILIASLLAFSGWMPAGRRNYGELVDPPQRLEPAATTAAGAVAWAHAAIDSAIEGRRNFEDTVGAPIDDILLDWYTALLLTGRTDVGGDPLPVEPRFTYLPRAVDPITGNNRGLDPYGDFMGMFNLEGPQTVTLATADGEIPGTGNELILVEADGTSPSLSVQVTGSETAALRVRIARLR